MQKPYLAIITPALAKANNGNWQTASRWARFLRPRYETACTQSWAPGGEPTGRVPDALIALHARRSAASIETFHNRHPDRPIVLVMTGTDIYRDIHSDATARRSMDLATVLVVLQAAALEELDMATRAKAVVVHQSAAVLRPPPPRTRRNFNVAMIGHLRSEKDPLTYLRALQHLRSTRVRMLHIGAILEPGFEAEIRSLQAVDDRYRWLGPLPHGLTRQRLKRCDVLAITSRMEGGANVVIEAIASGIPVIASDISGNRGLLGDDYEGYFPVGDAAALAALIDRAEADKVFLSRLDSQCRARAPLFLPEREKAAVCQLMDNLLAR